MQEAPRKQREAQMEQSPQRSGTRDVSLDDGTGHPPPFNRRPTKQDVTRLAPRPVVPSSYLLTSTWGKPWMAEPGDPVDLTITPQRRVL